MQFFLILPQNVLKNFILRPQQVDQIDRQVDDSACQDLNRYPCNSRLQDPAYCPHTYIHDHSADQGDEDIFKIGSNREFLLKGICLKSADNSISCHSSNSCSDRTVPMDKEIIQDDIYDGARPDCYNIDPVLFLGSGPDYSSP